MTYLVTINIGPVQDFIASARRSRDLWFGSWLLSELSKTAARYIHEHEGELIFPSPVDPTESLKEDSSFSVVNKLVALVHSHDVHSYCGELYQAILSRMKRIKDDAFADLREYKINGKSAIRWQEAEDQLSDLLEFYWAAVPFNGSDYQRARNNLEALLAARKVTRNFRAVTWGANVPKSSLDGLRESVIEETVLAQLDDPKLAPDKRARIEKELRTRYGLRGRERLCAIGLLKRHGKPKKDGAGIDSFFSTSHVAASPLLNRMKRDTVTCNGARTTALKTFIEKLQSRLNIITIPQLKQELGHVDPNATLRPRSCFASHGILHDGRLLYAERLREFFSDKSELQEAKEDLRKLIEALNDKDSPRVSEPLSYYAILHADGDRMGVVIDYQAAEGYAQHQKLSRTLSEFAERVKHIVEEIHEGSCVYSGGDDVLALLPLHTVLDCARDLADDFNNSLKSFADANGNTPTLSVGLAIGHHLDPLQETLALARDAERIAKKEVPNREQPSKNALAIILSKRSGAQRAIKGSWDKDKKKTPHGALDERLNRFVFLLLNDELPDGAAHELQDLALRLRPAKDATTDDRQTLLEAQKGEAKRILRRKQPQHGKKQTVAKTILDEFCGSKTRNGPASHAGYLDRIDLEDWTLVSLAEELIIAREFARAIEQAATTRQFTAKHMFFAAKEEEADDVS